MENFVTHIFGKETKKMPFFIPRNTMWNIKETQCNVNNLSSPSFSGEERGFQSVYSVPKG